MMRTTAMKGTWLRQAIPASIILVLLYSAQVFFFYAGTEHGINILRAFAIALQDLVIWLLLLPMALRLQATVSTSRSFLWHVPAGITFALAHISIDAVVNLLTGQLDTTGLKALWQQSLAGMLFVDMVAYFGIVALGTVLALRQRAEQEGSPEHETLVIRDGRERRIVRCNDILWIESANNHVGIHTRSGSWVNRDTLTRLEKLLPSNRFLRVHRSALVNIAFVERFTSGSRGDGALLLTDGSRINVSRRYRDNLDAALSR
jgi:DNA-binding LytR/AlgR family response regulator